jgi:hypothetical protein
MKTLLAVLLAAAAVSPAFAETPGGSDLNRPQRHLQTINMTPLELSTNRPFQIKSFSGTLKLTTAKQNVVIVKAGGSVPILKDGDKVEVQSGNATFTVNGETVSAGPGTTFDVSINSSGGVTLTPTAGTLVVTHSDGTKTTVDTNASMTVPPKTLTSETNTGSGTGTTTGTNTGSNTSNSPAPGTSPEQQQQVTSPSTP